MSGNIHFDVTGSNENFKRVMQDTRREIQDTENEASDALDSIIELLQQNIGADDLFGLKEAVADGKIQLDALRETIDKVSDAIEGMTSDSEKQAAREVVDELTERYNQLAGVVGEGEAALKAMSRALISGGIALGVAAAAAVALVVVIRSVTKECRAMNAAIEAGFASAQGQAAKWFADFSKAQSLWQSAQGDVDKLNAILRDHRDILDASGVAINNINDGNKAFIDNSDAMVQAINKRAVALAMEQATMAAANDVAKEYLEAEESIAKRENRNQSNMFRQIWNVFRFGRYQNGEMSQEAQEHYAAKDQRDREKAEKDAAMPLRIVQRLSQAATAARSEYEQMLQALGLTSSTATKAEKEHQQVLEDSIAKLQRYADAVAKLREQQALSASRQRATLQSRIEQAEIDAMQEGYEKQKRQREFNDRKALADIEQSKEDYVRAYRERERAIWEAQEEAIALQDSSYVKRAFDPSRVMPDTSAFDALYRAIKDKQRNDLITPLLSQYQSFEDKQKEILSRGSAEVSALLSQGYNEQAAKRRAAMKAELGRLKDQYDQTFQLIFRDPALMNIAQITEAIETAERKIEELSATPESQEANVQYIEALRQAIERLKGASSDFSLAGIMKMLFPSDTKGSTSFKERIDAISKAWDNMSGEQKWSAIGGWVSSIAGGLQKSAEYMRQVAEASGDTDLANVASDLSSVAQNFAAAGQGAAVGGWIGAIIGGVTDLLTQTVQALVAAKAAEAENAEIARQWETALRNVGAEMDELAFKSPFGERAIARGREGSRAALESLRTYSDALDELAKKYNNYNNGDISMYEGPTHGLLANLFTAGIFGMATYFTDNPISSEFKAYEDAIKKGYEGLQRMLIKTKDAGFGRLFGFHDQYTALADLYPQLFKDGELVVEQAKLLLETNNKLDDTQRREIENIIKLKEAYDEAFEVVDDAISGIFGNLGADLTDIIWDSVVNGGGNAWERFKELGGGAVTAIGKQLIQEMVVGEYLEQFRQQMRDAYALGNAADTQASLRSIVADIFDGMGVMLEAGSAVAAEYAGWAQEHGFDLAETSEQGRTAVAKALTSVSQDSWDVVDGKITNMMMRLLDIDDRFSVVQDVQLRMLERVTVISEHTANLDRMRQDMTAMRSELEDIRTRGIKMQQI